MHTDDLTTDSTSRVRARAPRRRLIAVASRRVPTCRNLDPAGSSGGMFISSARFASEPKKKPAAELSIHGSEKTDETGRLCRTRSVRGEFSNEPILRGRTVFVRADLVEKS